MSSSKRIFELQQVDISIQAKSKELEKINLCLNHDEAYELAKSNHDIARAAQKEREKLYKDLDAEAEGIRASMQQINDKLYGGKIKNPKELVGYEQEAGMFKGNLSKKDDVLLELMEKIDAAKIEMVKLQEVYTAAERDWQSRKVTLTVQADQLKDELAGLEKKRQEILTEVDKPTLIAYENIKSRKGQAVVRVEQGRCLGCRVSLSVSELQRVRGMSIVTCSNCGRMLYLS
jgi:uncharacterized protein